MLTFFRSRRSILLALACTSLALYGLLTRQSYDAEWMLRWNHVDIGQVQLIYVIFIGVLLLALPYAGRIQTALQRGRVLVLILTAVACFLSISLLEPNQEHRLFITAFSIWIIIAHVLALSSILVWVVTASDTSLDKPSQYFNFRSLGRYLLIVLFGLLILLHIFSLPNFISLDLPDEPFNASIATNYALNNDLSSQYIGSAYGSPDVVFPRYYWVMGVWLKAVNSTSLAAMRAFPVLVAGLALAIFVFALWWMRRIVGLTGLQILVGAVVLLSLSPFLRTAHDLRMDILLAVYSSLMLWGMLGFWGNARQPIRYLLLMGFALFLGMEAIPLIAVPMSLSTGVMLTLWWTVQPNKRHNLRYVFIYAVACTVGIGAYYLLQFLPNIADGWDRYRAFVQSYSSLTGVGTLRFPLEVLSGYIGRFSLILSPAEVIVSLLAFIALWRMKLTADRWILASIGMGFLLVLVFFRLAYSYTVGFTPFMAYAIARVALSSRFKTAVIFCVAIPALVAVPIFDLVAAVQDRPNETRLETADTLTPYIPEGSTVVGEDLFWFTLHEKHNFIGINGLNNYVAIKGVSYLDALQALHVDKLLCDTGNPMCELVLQTGYFGDPVSHQVGNSTFLLYPHSGS